MTREQLLEKALLIARVGYYYWRERCHDHHPGLYFIKKIVIREISSEFPKRKKRSAIAGRLRKGGK